MNFKIHLAKAGSVYSSRLFYLALVLVAFGLCMDVFVLLRRLDAPLLDSYSFRQTQTALTSFWLLRGGAFLAYQTPVLGAPWAIPFEFPLYQGLASLVSLTGVPLDAAGRIVSFFFFILFFIPLKMLWTDLKLPALGFPITCALLLLSPEYAFYSRTFLIESCAWFFSLLWLALFVRFLGRGEIGYFLFSLIAGACAVLVKSTTLPAFLVLGGLMFLWSGMLAIQNKDLNKNTVKLIAAASLLIIPILVGSVWVEFSDAVKTQNIIGQYLTGKALELWNFGTLSQRLSFKLWVEVILGRVFSYTLGIGWIFGILSFFTLRSCPYEKRIILALLLAFLTPFLVFTNLHMEHSYYQYANAAFLIFAVGIALGCLGQQNRRPVLTTLLFSLLAFFEIASFFIFPLRWIHKNPQTIPDYRVALVAKTQIPSGQSLLIIGDDWTSVVPYYSQHKSLAIPAWLKSDQIEKILDSPQAYLGSYPLGGIVVCEPTLLSSANEILLEKLTSKGSVIFTYKNCSLIKFGKKSLSSEEQD